MIIGKRIKQLSKNKEVSVIDLAQKLDVSTTAIYDIFKKDKLSTDILEKISEILNIPMADFFEDNAKTVIGKDNNGNVVQNSTHVNIDSCKQEIVSLKEQVRLQGEIIDLLKKNQR